MENSHEGSAFSLLQYFIDVNDKDNCQIAPRSEWADLAKDLQIAVELLNTVWGEGTAESKPDLVIELTKLKRG